MEQRQSLQQVVLRKLDSHMQNNEIKTFPHTIYKNKLKWFKNLHVSPKTTKLVKNTYRLNIL